MKRWLLLVVMLAAAAATAEVEDTEEFRENEAPAEETGRTFSEWGKSFMEWMGFDYDDYDDYDYDYEYFYPSGSGSSQVGYGLPSVGYISPSAGGSHSSYSSYSPYQSAPHPQFIRYNARDDDFEDSTWSVGDMLFNLAVTAVPLGLLLSALPTSMLTVAVRRRSLGDTAELEASLDPSELPLLHTLLQTEDLTSLVAPQCQRKLFCEITKIGERENASFLQRAMYYAATLTPDPVARRLGLVRLFRAARAGACEALVCAGPPALPPLPQAVPPPPSNHLSDAPSKQDAEE